MRPWLRRAMVLAIAVAGAIALVTQWDRVRDEATELTAGALLGAGAAAAAAAIASMLAWRAVLHDLGAPLPAAAGARLFFLAQLGKYVPGGVWPVVTHMELGREYDVRRHRTAAALAVTTALSIVTAALLAAALLPLAAGDRAADYAPLLAVVPLIAVTLHPRVLARILEWGLRRLGREPLERAPTWRGVLVATAWLSAMWLLFGGHAWLLARDLGGDGAGLLALCTGAFAVAWSAGFLFLLTPAGLGVREAALVALLAGEIGASGATVLALASRLLLTAADLALAALAALLARRAAR